MISNENYKLACAISLLVIVIVSPYGSALEDRATIQNLNYSINDALNLHAVIQSSFSRDTFLLLEVAEAYSTVNLAVKTVQVGAGSKTQTVEIQLNPPNDQLTWSIRVSLYLSNAQSEKVELLQYKIIDIDLKQHPLDWGLIVLALLGALIGGILIQRETVKRRNRADWRKRKMKRKHRA